MKLFIFTALTALSSISAFAQSTGSSQMTCHINTHCSVTGDCTPASEDVIFRLTDKEVGRHGEGTYGLSYRGASAEALNVSMVGPLVWSEGLDDQQVLSFLALGASSGPAVWTSAQLDDSKPGSVTFLNCRVDD